MKLSDLLFCAKVSISLNRNITATGWSDCGCVVAMATASELFRVSFQQQVIFLFLKKHDANAQHMSAQFRFLTGLGMKKREPLAI